MGRSLASRNHTASINLSSHQAESPPTAAAEMGNADCAAGRRAKKRKQTDGRSGQAESVDAVAEPQASQPLLGGGSKKRRGNGRRIEHAVPMGAGAQPQGRENSVAGAPKTPRGNQRREHSGPGRTAAHSQQAIEGVEPGGVGVDPGTADVFPLLELPTEMRELILGYVPLRNLARLACLGKALRSAYRERVRKRDAAVADLLASHFTAEFRERLCPAQTALPYDLIVHPQMDPLLQAAPEACRLLSGEGGPWVRYEGFCMARKADERGDSQCKGGEQNEGDWRMENCEGHGIIPYTAGRYVGEWKAKLPHGFGTQILPSGASFAGQWRKGQRHGRGTYTTSNPLYLYN